MKNLLLVVKDFILFVTQFAYYLMMIACCLWMLLLFVVLGLVSIPFGYESEEHTNVYKKWREVVDMVIPD